jgi:large subunit ribosomal protein L10
MLTRVQKEEQVAELRDKFGRASGVVVAEYRGIDVAAVEKLRKRLRAEGDGGYEYRVSKNTLLRRAAEGSGAEAIAQHFDGPTAIALSFGDPVGLAKILVDFAKEHEVFKIRGGLIEGRPVAGEEIAALATLPPLAALRARLVGLIQAPAQRLVGVLAAPGGQVARVVEARRKQLEESGGAA